ncbi:hypothetical protein ASC90_00855 [Rhizobium sp. Root1220]|nr:hypothetical protein ASC90_00855 [Rhizobium sp. Root1220]
MQTKHGLRFKIPRKPIFAAILINRSIYWAKMQFAVAKCHKRGQQEEEAVEAALPPLAQSVAVVTRHAAIAIGATEGSLAICLALDGFCGMADD